MSSNVTMKSFDMRMYSKKCPLLKEWWPCASQSWWKWGTSLHTLATKASVTKPFRWRESLRMGFKLSTMSNCQQCQIANNVKLSNVKMSKCQIVKISKCQNVKMSNCKIVRKSDKFPPFSTSVFFSCPSRRGEWRTNAISPQLLLKWSKGWDSSVHPVVWGKTPFSAGEN